MNQPLATERHRILWGETEREIRKGLARLTQWFAEHQRQPRRWWKTRKWLLTGEAENPEIQGGETDATGNGTVRRTDSGHAD